MRSRDKTFEFNEPRKAYFEHKKYSTSIIIYREPNRADLRISAANDHMALANMNERGRDGRRKERKI